MDRVHPDLAAVTLPDADGGTHHLGELWKGRPALILWVRHFG